MLDKILVPVDGSALAEAVLPHVVAVTRINGSRVTLLHVVEENAAETQIDPVDWRLRKTEAQSYLAETSKRLERFNLPAAQVVLEGPAAERIVEYAQKENFDLVALSTHGQHGLSSWNLSSVAHKVIERIHKSTLIVPAHGSAGHRTPNGELYATPYQNILAPLDGSTRAECILPLASALARHHNANLILTHVVTPPDMIQRVPLSESDRDLLHRIVERNRAEAHRYFEQLRSRLSPEPQIRILESDNVERALLKFVEDEPIDLVVLAAHGHSGHSGHPYGRLAASFINYGSAPLYVHQDLEVSEIEPLYAERMLLNDAPPKEKRINAHEYAIK
ncbi:MAG: universal stress protein [Caldilineaceae bacterium]|nr:universal stress protein [Caldilineaceae bacterium]MCB9156871.1 universal stress protein [Caldilineaceae bacterium]